MLRPAVQPHDVGYVAVSGLPDLHRVSLALIAQLSREVLGSHTSGWSEEGVREAGRLLRKLLEAVGEHRR